MLNYVRNLFNNTKTERVITDETSIGPTVVWIHGANQSALSFAYLRSVCGFSKEIAVNYSSMNRFYSNLETMIGELESAGPLFVVGHSLGGLYALHLTRHVNVVAAVSISTPYRGSSAADWAKYIVPSYPLFRDVGRRSPAVVAAEDIVLDVPWTQVVSTIGSVPYLNGPNDGVVTVASMRHRSDMTHIEVPHTHYEVMCSDVVADIILQKYNQINN